MAAIRKLRDDRYVVDFHLFGHRIRTFFVDEEPAIEFKEKVQTAFPSRRLESIDGSIKVYLTNQTDKRKALQTGRMERLWFYELKMFLKSKCGLDLESSITQVQRIHLEKFQTYLVKHGNVRGSALSNASINRRFNTFKNLFARLREWGLLQENPSEHIRRLPEKINRRKKWQAADIKKVLGSKLMSALDRDIFCFLHETGIRLGSLTAIKCGDVNLHDRTIVIWQRKGHGQDNSYVIPMSDDVRKIVMRRITKNFDTHLFRGPRGRKLIAGSQSKRFIRLFAKLKLSHLKLHGLRHTFASSLSARGASTEAIRRLLGHGSVKTTEHYLNLDMDQLRRWIS